MKRLAIALVFLSLVGLIAFSAAGVNHCDYCSCGNWSDFTWTQRDGAIRFNACCPSRVTQYTWSFGDGTNYSTFSDSSFNHFYEESGTYKVILRAKNRYGNWSSTTHWVRVEPVPYYRTEASVKLTCDECTPEAFAIGLFTILLLASLGD